MSQEVNWVVYRRNDGLWAKKIRDSKIASSVHATQEQAENSAREILKNRDGGKLFIEGFDGKIRIKDTFSQTVLQSSFRARDTSS
jgi:hypothetical protein